MVGGRAGCSISAVFGVLLLVDTSTGTARPTTERCGAEHCAHIPAGGGVADNHQRCCANGRGREFGTPGLERNRFEAVGDRENLVVGFEWRQGDLLRFSATQRIEDPQQPRHHHHAGGQRGRHRRPLERQVHWATGNARPSPDRPVYTGGLRNRSAQGTALAAGPARPSLPP